MSAYQKFMKAVIAKHKEVSTGSVLLDRSFMVPLGSTLLITGKSQSGTTALSLDLAMQLSKDKVVVYYDFLSSVLSNRLYGINLDNFILVKDGFVPFDLIELIQNLSLVEENLVLVLDGLFIFENLLIKGWTATEVVKRIRQINPLITVIATQRHKSCSSIWNRIVNIEHVQNIYADNMEGESTLQGQLSKIFGPIGNTLVYIDKATGRLNKAFEYSKLLIESKEKTSNSLFQYNGVEAQGVWNFIHRYSEKIKDEVNKF